MDFEVLFTTLKITKILNGKFRYSKYITEWGFGFIDNSLTIRVDFINDFHLEHRISNIELKQLKDNEKGISCFVEYFIKEKISVAIGQAISKEEF